MLTSRRLHHFLTLATHGHFGHAATALNITQPALSKSIQGLEQELGVQLFDRKRGMVTLTQFGELVSERSKQLLVAESDLKREVALFAKHEFGTLKVALGPYPSITSGYAGIGRLADKYPKIATTVHVVGWREVASKVRLREVDLGIAEIGELGSDDDLDIEPLPSHPGHWACRPGHPLMGCKPVTLTEALAYPWIGPRLPARIASRLPLPLGAAGRIDPSNGDFIPAIEIDVPVQLPELLGNSNALAVATYEMLDADIAAGRIAVLPAMQPQFYSSYGFIFLKGRSLAPATLAYMREVREIEAGISERETAILARHLSTDV